MFVTHLTNGTEISIAPGNDDTTSRCQRCDKLVDADGVTVTATLSDSRRFPEPMHQRCAFSYYGYRPPEEVTCLRCGGEGYRLIEEDGRDYEDACYHCRTTGRCTPSCCGPDAHLNHEDDCPCDYCRPPLSYPCSHGDPCECSTDIGDDYEDEAVSRYTR